MTDFFLNSKTIANYTLKNKNKIVIQFIFRNLAQYQISGNRNLFIWQLNDPGLLQYDYLMDARVFFMSTDSWLLDNDVLEEEDITILDVKDISLKFLTKFNVSVAKKMSRYQEVRTFSKLESFSHKVGTAFVPFYLFSVVILESTPI